MKRTFKVLLLLAALAVLGAGCASTSSSEYPFLSVGGYGQFRYTSFEVAGGW